MTKNTTDTFADDTAILSVHENPTIAGHRLQMHLTKNPIMAQHVENEGE
jgi:hypothetical protein